MRRKNKTRAARQSCCSLGIVYACAANFAMRESFNHLSKVHNKYSEKIFVSDKRRVANPNGKLQPKMDR